MQTSLDPESKSLIEQTLRRFLADCYDPAARLERLAADAVDYREHWATLAHLGVLALAFDEDHGGPGASPRDLADAVRVLAPGLILEPFAQTAIVAGRVLAAGADAATRAACVERLVEGSRVTVLAGGRDARCDRLRCERTADGLRLTGSLRVVPYAVQADEWLIVADDAQGKPVIVRVDAARSHAKLSGYRLMDGRPAADLVFEDEHVERGGLWLEGEAAQRAMDGARLDAVNVLCAEAVGVMESLIAVTGEYLRTRVQFGAPLATYQALQHRYVDMYMAYIESSAISREYADALGAEDREARARLACSAALVVARAARLVGHEAIQMHGGIGVTDELMVSHGNARLAVITSMLRDWRPEWKS
ncbi:alkylation response protein AidB-like acyl-CoA dehydrogenase [Paraburkholderia unamae]|uniref:acyl-CoA dehydrogenase family protein n=1 Tax=Paraburkholderia unamae TaxID=219649 RepID=UPI000DC2963C|nr:acyl-CoA dehydrogenase family protein [Paraburkholderia unamae]RAR57846.1 alkylation response protein AidB-like acyl-CoA dehydrogenase [Paraburkholderia unamae]